MRYICITVNSDEGRARWELTKKHLEEAGATDITLFVAEPHRNPVIGCRESHITCNEFARDWFKANNEELTTILEDDVRLKPEWKQHWEEVIVPAAQKVGADMIMGGVSSGTLKIETVCCIDSADGYNKEKKFKIGQMNAGSGFFMYAFLNERAMAEFIAMRVAERYAANNIDVTFMRKPNMKIYTCLPFVASVTSGYSLTKKRIAHHWKNIDSTEQKMQKSIELAEKEAERKKVIGAQVLAAKNASKQQREDLNKSMASQLAPLKK